MRGLAYVNPFLILKNHIERPLTSFDILMIKIRFELRYCVILIIENMSF